VAAEAALAPLKRRIVTASSAEEALARLLEKALEEKHRAGYERHPVQEGEFDLWEGEQVWVD
jgi:hypothetical protein